MRVLVVFLVFMFRCLNAAIPRSQDGLTGECQCMTRRGLIAIIKRESELLRYFQTFLNLVT